MESATPAGDASSSPIPGYAVAILSRRLEIVREEGVGALSIAARC